MEFYKVELLRLPVLIFTTSRYSVCNTIQIWNTKCKN